MCGIRKEEEDEVGTNGDEKEGIKALGLILATAKRVHGNCQM